ncbi:MAG: hypothetical protein ACFBZ8_00010 [Opitutales bacterium]
MSVDLAWYSNVPSAIRDNVVFEGFRAGERVTQQSFPISTITFSTFYFDGSFTAVDEVRVAHTAYSMNNFVAQTVPEPGAFATMLGLVAVCFALCRTRKNQAAKVEISDEKS